MNAYIPYGAYWSTPFARWQGAFAHLHQSHAKMKRYHERHSSDAKRAAASQYDSQASDRSSDYAMSSPL